MNKINKVLHLGRLSDYNHREAIVLWLALAVWLPFYISAAILITVPIILICTKDGRTQLKRQKNLTALAILVSGVSLSSSIISGNLLGVFYSVGIFTVMFVGSYIKSVMTRNLFDKVTVFIGCGSVVGFIVAVVQVASAHIRNIEKLDEFRTCSTAYNPNYFGTIAVLSAILMFVRFFEKNETKKDHSWQNPTKVFYCTVFLINFASILICESRSSLLGLTACAVAYLFFSKRYILCTSGAIFVAAIWILGYFYPNFFSWSNSLFESFLQRNTIWFDALKSFSQNAYTITVGRGPMTYQRIWETEGLYPADHAHNLLADILINVGVLGLILYTLFFAEMIRHGIMARKTNKTAFLLTLLLIIDIAVQGIADVTIMWHQSGLLVFLIFSYSSVKDVDTTD